MVQVEGHFSTSFLLPRTVAHRKSESAHTRTHTKHRAVPAHTCVGMHMRTVPVQEPQGWLGKRATAAAAKAVVGVVVAAAASDDLLLELVNAGHPERRRGR